LRQGVYSEWLIDRAPEHLRRNLEMCGRLLEAVPGPAEANLLVAGMARGLTGPRVDSVPRVLEQAMARLWSATPARSAGLVTLAARLGRDEAAAEAIARMQGGRVNDADRPLFLELFASTAPPAALPILADLVRNEKNDTRRAQHLAALAGFEGGAAVVIELFPTFSPRLKSTAQRMLAENRAWALPMLQRMSEGTFEPGVLSTQTLALLRGHGDPRIASLLTSYQQRHSDDPAERVAQQLFETGRTAYALSCAPCHGEVGEGRIGLAPAMVGSPWLQAGDDVVVRILLQGKENKGRGLIMPPWSHLEDQQIAAVLTFVRREFGNQAGAVEPATVGQVRAATRDRATPWTDAELQKLPAKTAAR
jgi:mono/diheme cytochrome c family protein